MDKKPLFPVSPNSQGSDEKAAESNTPSSSRSAFESPAIGTKPKRERSPLRIPSSSRMFVSHHVLDPTDGAKGISCSGIGLPVQYNTAVRNPNRKGLKFVPKSTGTKPKPETSEDCDKPPTCTKPDPKDVVDYYESLDNIIKASIKSVETSPPSKTFWETTGAIPKHFAKDSTRTPPKVLPPFQKTPTPTKLKARTALFPDDSDPVGKSDEQKAEDPSKDASSSTGTKSPTPKSRSDFNDHMEWVKYNCLDFQDYKRTVNNKQKGAESSLHQLLPAMNSAMKDAQRLAAKISKVRSELCGSEEALRIQNDKLKYLVGRTMATFAKIDDVLERFREDILAYTTLTTEGNEGIDMRLSRLLMVLCGFSERELAFKKFSLIREAFSEESTRTPK